MDSKVLAIAALVIGAGAGFFIGKGEKEVVEVEKVVEAKQTSTLDAVKGEGFHSMWCITGPARLFKCR